MKAAVLHANRDLRYEDYPEPITGDGGVKVRVRACGICGSDVPRVLHNGAHFYPIVLGHEFSGEVVEIGKDVTSVKVGDHVSGAPLLPCMSCPDCQVGNYSLCKRYSFIGSRQQGAFAQYVVIPEINAVKYDASIPFEQAALFEPATVALHGIRCIGYKGGGTVAVLGGGTIGIFAMQWAKIFGAKQVVMFDVDEDKLELARKLGADETINTSKDGYMQDAKALTAGRGFDYILETAGSHLTIAMAFELAANKARICCVGTPRADVVFSPGMWELMNRKEFLLTGSWMSYSAPFPGEEWSLAAHYYATGALRFNEAMIYKKLPLSEAAQGFFLFDNPGQVKGKVLLTNE